MRTWFTTLCFGVSAVILACWIPAPAVADQPEDVVVATPQPYYVFDDGEILEGGLATGPDVIVGDVNGVTKWGTLGTPAVTGYSLGTTSCNVGTVPLEWISGTNHHSVVGQGIFRMKNGRFEQIGIGWLKHTFCALQQNICGACTPYCGGCCDHLGVGCSDPYTSSRNGTQTLLGPRSPVNPHTGVYPYPQSIINQTGNVLYKRIQVLNDDLNPSLNAGALYFGECQYVTQDDAGAANQNNNASYRQLTVGALSGSPPGYTVSVSSSTQRGKPALQAWKDNDTTVTLNTVDVTDDGRFIVAYRTSDNGNGTWHYELAIQNLNADRSGGSVSLPIPAGVYLLNIAFRSIAYHDGDGVVVGTNYSNAPWTVTNAGGTLSWATETEAANPNANALRWGTVYNFRFDANRPPNAAAGTGTLGLWRSGTPDGVSFAMSLPSAPPAATPGDLNCDSAINNSDIDAFVLAIANPAGYFAAFPTCNIMNADVNNDGILNNFDIDPFVALLIQG